MRRARNPRNSRDVAEIIMRCRADLDDEFGIKHGFSKLYCEDCPGSPRRQGVCWKEIVAGLLEAFEFRNLGEAIEITASWYSWYIIGLGPKRASKKDKESELLARWMLFRSDRVLAMSRQAMAKDAEWSKMLEEAGTKNAEH